ncbi:asparagine synthetase B [Candidatus Bathyarchaeota archaeon]|nr:MAG: asparagine synthetase B [Candidatus Bathyarchaeota archaeon]
MAIYAFAEIKNGKARRIFASAKYPSKQRGNLFFDSEKVPDLRKTADLPHVMGEFYALVAFRPSYIFLSRDVFGGKPLYYDLKTLTFSSFKKYFEGGCLEVNPGESIKIDYNGKILERKITHFEDVFRKKNIDISEAKEKIEKYLTSFKTKHACLAFSGGVDSSFLASLYDVELISVTASKKEEEWIKNAARSIGKKVNIYVFKEKDVKEAAQEVPFIIETDNILQISIAIPIYIALKFANRLGYRKVIFGQGADELFGGYKRYETLESHELEESLRNDLKNIGKNNLVRDTKLSYALEMKILAPYLQWEIIKTAV